MITEQDKKSIILHSARELFFRFGFNKTSMDDIAVQSSLAKPTLYYYYTNKEAIFNEIVIDEAKRFMDSVEKKIPHDIPADEQLMLFFRKTFSGLKEYAAKMIDVPDCLYNHSPHGRPIVEKINQLFFEKLQPLLKAGMEEGIFAFDDEQATLSSLVLMTDFLNLDWIHRTPKKKANQVVEGMITILLNGLRRRK